MATIEERADRYIDNNFTRIAEEVPICEGMKTLYIESATEQRKIDIGTIPQLYVRWLMIDGEKPSWEEYATKAMEEK